MRHALFVAILLNWAATVCAAPAPKGGALGDKYLLDDTDFVVVVNVKQALASPLFAKNYEKLVGDFLKSDLAQPFLKDCGFDPLKDLEQIVLVLGRSCFEGEKNHDNGPVVLFRGKFDAAKFDAKGAELAKTFNLKVTERGNTKVYETPQPLRGGVARLDNETVCLSARVELINELLDKAAGKRKTALKNKVVKELIEKLDGEKVVETIATGDMVTSISYTGRAAPGVPAVTERRVHTLGESGVNLLRVSVDVKDDAKVRVSLTTRDEETAKQMSKAIEDGIQKAVAEAGRRKELEPVARAMKAAKVAAKGSTITIEGAGDAEAVQGLVMAMFSVGEERPVPGGPVPVPVPVPPPPGERR